jgi:hypothetical protein
MRPQLIFFMFLISIANFYCDDYYNPIVNRRTDAGIPVKFDEYGDYSCKDNTLKPDTTAFFCFFGKTKFDEKFYMIYDHRTPKTIPDADFNTKHIFAVAKRSYYYMEFKVDTWKRRITYFS